MTPGVLALKLALVPALIAAVTLAARRWGPRVGGLLGALPLVAGPVLFFLGVEQGDAFLATAARTALAGLVGVAAFGLAFAWASLRSGWMASLLAGWAAFAAAALALQAIHWSATAALGVAVGAFLVARACLPPQPATAASLAAPAWDLPVRMGAAVVLVLAVTSLAAWLGPRLSGALTPFPVATAVLLAFTHGQQGPAATVGYLRGFLPAMGSFALFCFVIAVAAVPLGYRAAFVGALAAQLVVHAAILGLLQRPTRRHPARRRGGVV